MQLARPAVTAAWLVSCVILFRFWDLTVRFEAVLVWTAVFIALYAASMFVLLHFGLLVRRRPWAHVWAWCAIWAVATLGQLAFPTIALSGRAVQTVAIFRVLDIVLPLWIIHRGVHAAWTGRAAIGVTLAVPGYLLLLFWFGSVRMPGTGHVGPLESLTPEEVVIRDRALGHVRMLSDSIGVRGSRGHTAVAETVEYIRRVLTELGYAVETMPYVASNRDEVNLQVSIAGSTRPGEIVVVGAHYDTYDETPGADDNATGVAGVLEIARMMADRRPERTIRFVFFGTEEPPFFNTDRMGSHVYAAASRLVDENVVAMYSLEMLGYFDDAPGSQRHPPPMQLFFPDRGDFVAFAGNPASGRLLRRSLEVFRRSTRFPSEGVVAPSMVPGVELSDHASFWRHGYPAVVISDTGPFRNDHYHLDDDRVDTLDFDRMARLVAGIERVVADAAGS